MEWTMIAMKTSTKVSKQPSIWMPMKTVLKDANHPWNPVFCTDFANPDDCNDNDPLINPFMDEVCDEEDNDCEGFS